MNITALIQGASRGLGLQFCRALLSKHDGLIVATCRSPEKATALHSLQEMYKDRLHVYQLDVSKENDIKATSERLSNDFGDELGIDLLINSAGIIHPTGKGETSLREVDQNDVTQVMLIDAIGPLLVAKHFLPFLAKGTGRFGIQSDDKRKKHSSLLVNLSARIGSIGDNKLGGWYSYRMAKSALNMMNKSLSIELGRGKSKVICVNVHPGTVDTDLTRRYHRNLPPGQIISPEVSIEHMLTLVQGLTIADTGKYLAYDGSEIEW